jgi:hypothetical protein
LEEFPERRRVEESIWELRSKGLSAREISGRLSVPIRSVEYYLSKAKR